MAAVLSLFTLRNRSERGSETIMSHKRCFDVLRAHARQIQSQFPSNVGSAWYVLSPLQESLCIPISVADTDMLCQACVSLSSGFAVVINPSSELMLKNRSISVYWGIMYLSGQQARVEPRILKSYLSQKSWKTCIQVGKWIVLASYALVTWWGWRQRLCPWRGLFPQQCLQVRFPLPQTCNWERWTPEARPHPPQRSTDTQIPSHPQTPLGYLSCCTHSNKQNLFRVPSCINLHS